MSKRHACKGKRSQKRCAVRSQRRKARREVAEYLQHTSLAVVRRYLEHRN